MKILNELRQSKQQVLIIIFALVLSICAFILLESFKDSVETTIAGDTKALAGGDIVIDSNDKFTNNLAIALNEIEKNSDVKRIDTYEFSSIIYSKEKNSSLLAQIKLVEEGYPLYGTLELGKKSNNSNFINSGEIVVEKNLLERLEVQIGDLIEIGGMSFKIKDIIIKEPDRSLSFFSIGPRIIAKVEDFENSPLIGEKSRVEYETYIKINDEKNLEEYFQFLKGSAGPKEDIELYTDEQNSLRWFVRSFLLFLQIIVFFSIILGGLGMSSALSSFFIEKRKSIAIRKTLGETNKNILLYYSKIIFFLIIISFTIILILSYLAIKVIPILLKNLLPAELIITLSLIGIIKGFILLFTISYIFALIPLKNIQYIKPLEILKENENIKEQTSFKDKVLIGFLISIVSIIMLIEFGDLIDGIKFLLGFAILFTITYSLVSIILLILEKLKFNSYILRLSIKSLLRKGNKNVIMLTTLTCALSLIFTIFFLQYSIQEQFSESFPKNAPNTFFIDIQPKQVTNFSMEFNNTIEIFPVVRGRIIEARGLDIQEIRKGLGPGEPVTREFSLTYSETLIGEEELTKTQSLFLENWDKKSVQVSVMDEIAQRLNVKIGDEIIFNIQGVELNSEVVSFRTRTTQSLTPFFYFVFEPKVLEKAPQTIFTAMNLPENEIAKKQLIIAKKYPNITTIDLTQILVTIRELISKLSIIITFFTLLSISSGILIFISSLYSTAQSRTKESVYYKLVGMKGKDVQKIFLIEFSILAIISSFLSLLLSHLSSAIIITNILDSNYSYSIIISLLLILFSIIIITLIGYLNSYKIIYKRPIEFLRENNKE